MDPKIENEPTVVKPEEEEYEKENKNEQLIELSPEDEAKYKIIRSIGEECIQQNELRSLIKYKSEKGEKIICYDGFEPSGRIHIAQGFFRAINVNKLTQNGCKVIFWVADWFALMNNKMGGDLQKIQTVGKYLIEVWKVVGMDMQNVEFRWASEEINKNPNDYWLRVLDISRKFTVSRINRCSQIMGRSQKEELNASQIFYPCMQCADIFYIKADICQLGVDQRKVNMLAREYCDLINAGEGKKKQKLRKPIVLSHHMILGLTGEKMSKSDPMAAIFMEDSKEDVNKKIKQAFCEEGNIEKNPVLEYVKYIVFPLKGEFKVKRDEKYGGDQTYKTIEEVFDDFKNKKLHPGDAKAALKDYLNEILEPVREHFKNNKEAAELLKKVKSYIVTR
jgi:tyrosyl-tRNA synthetase